MARLSIHFSWLVLALAFLQGCPSPSNHSETGSLSWAEVTTRADFEGRRNHTSVTFSGKMWVIGGLGDFFATPLDIRSDVWYSQDGIAWTEAASNAGFGPRSGHTSVIFDDKIWVIGGFDDAGYTNSVWYSPDGVTWTEATPHAGFSARSFHESVVFDGKIWVIGGNESDNVMKNDVWYSEDGITWTQATSNADFSPRFGHTALVFDGKIWVIAGEDDGSKKSDVWYSSDGIVWTQATSTADFGRRMNHSSIVDGDKMWVLMGWDGSDYRNDAWYSLDGESWSRASSDIRNSGGKGEHTSLFFDGLIWILAGADEEAPQTNDIWKSEGAGL